MQIKLWPTRCDDVLEIEKHGETLLVNGEVFDFSPLTEGSTLPGAAITGKWFIGDIEKINGDIKLAMFLPIPANFSPEQAFPADLVDVPDGPVQLPQPLPEPAEANEVTDEH